jgi:hypothetical protein
LTRLNDYINAIKFWLHYPGSYSAIVFIDNSGYDLEDIKEAFRNNPFKREIEILQSNDNTKPEGVHYGYSEMAIIDYAINNSDLISRSQYFIKVTGRIYFPKLERLIQKTEGYHFVADSRDWKKRRYVLTTIFISSISFYKKQLYNIKYKLSPNMTHMETLFYRTLKPLLNDKANKVLLRFPFNVNPVGIGSHWGKDYSSFKIKIENVIRGIARVLVPWFKI